MQKVSSRSLSRSARLGLALLLALVGLALVPPPAKADGAVHLYYFFDHGCSVCAIVHREVIEPCQAEFGSRLVVDERDMADPATFEYLLALETQFKVTAPGIPEVFVGTDALIGDEALHAQFRERIEYYLAQGGVALPEVPGKPAPTRAPIEMPTPGWTVSPAPISTATPLPATQRPIFLAWFYNPGCDLCERKEHDLSFLVAKYPQVRATRFDGDAEVALFQYLGQRAGVPESRQLVAPAVFIADQALVAEQISTAAMEAMIQPYLSTGSPEPWAGFDEAKHSAEQTIIDRFRSLGILTVVGAGLIDGLNPCAFATMIFLISYLSVRKRRGRELLATGAAFTTGVFLAYLGLGLGMLKFLTTLPILSTIGKWIYGVTMLLCLGLALGSLSDYRKARQGRLEDMSLKMPDYLRGLQRRIIREGSRSSSFVLASFGLGFVVSVVELACTGQVYLPTIVFVLGLAQWRARATAALVIYNLMFIVPLIAVFLLVYYGTTSQQLTRWMQKHAASIKFGMAVLFLLLAAWLGYSIISV